MTTIEEKIKVPSSMLNTNLKQNIMALLNNKVGTINKKHGCITRIYLDTLQILHAEINTADSSNEFTIQYTFQSFTPLVGVAYNATVVETYPEGIVVSLKTNIDGLIIGTNAQNKFDECGCVAVKGASLLVEFDQLVYKSNQFQGVGRHVHSDVVSPKV